MALFGTKEVDVAPALLEKEARFIAQLNQQAYEWLGPRYVWYNKVRNAGKGGFHLFQGQNLEEQMEATRSALTLVTRNVNASLVLAFNTAVEAVKNAEEVPEEWPEKVEMADRNNPPALSDTQDALLLAYTPVKFLNIAKAARDKGKGIDFYAEGLMKKFFFKVVAFYADPSHWSAERLGYFLAGLPEDAPLADVNAKLGSLKADLEQFMGFYGQFRFGSLGRAPGDATTRNQLEEVIPFTKKDMLTELFLQSLIYHGLENFLFRYFLTLVASTGNPRAIKGLAQIFEPALAKAIEVRVRYQASFSLEREKMRLRTDFHEFYRALEALPVTETVKGKRGPVRKINYSHKLLEATNFARTAPLSERAAQRWAAFLEPQVVGRQGSEVGPAGLLEVLNLMVHLSRSTVEGRIKVARALRDSAEEQEKLSLRQVAQHKKALADAVRKKMARARKFKVMEQFEMQGILEKEAADLEAEGNKQIEALEQSIAKRREATLERAKQMEAAAEEEGRSNLGRVAGEIYRVAEGLDPRGDLHATMVQYLVRNIQEDKDTHYHDLYKNLFTVLPLLSPTEKIVLRKALETKIELAEDEMTVSPEEMRAFEEQIVTRKTEIMTELGGVFDLKLLHGPVRITLDALLKLGIQPASLRLLLQMPFTASNKPSVRIPPPVAAKLMALNRFMHPFPEHDLLLPNVDEKAPPARRLNFNRLAKL